MSIYCDGRAAAFSRYHFAPHITQIGVLRVNEIIEHKHSSNLEPRQDSLQICLCALTGVVAVHGDQVEESIRVVLEIIGHRLMTVALNKLDAPCMCQLPQLVLDKGESRIVHPLSLIHI